MNLARRMTCSFAAVLLATPMLRAQDISPQKPGFSVQVHGIAGRMKTPIYPQAEGRSGLGFGGEVTYGASPRLGIFGAVTRFSSKSETLVSSTDYSIVQGDVGLRWASLPGARVRPFAEAGLAVRRLAFTLADSVPLDFTAMNAGVSVSAGVMIFQSDRVSLEAAGTYSSGNFSSWQVNGKAESIAAVTSETLGIRVGMRYWFTK